MKYSTSSVWLSLSFLLLFVQDSFSQNSQNIFSSERFFNENTNRKGRMFLAWGYNRAEFTKSDIHFKGNNASGNYDFTINNTAALDRQSDFAWDIYFNPARFTVPQYDFTLGYYLTNKFALTINMDHMKYVMVEDQIANISGNINEVGNPYNDIYNNTPTKITEDFLTFEHTDGLNYANIEGSFTQDIYSSKSGNFALETMMGVGIGALVPKSNVKLFNYPRNDAWHLAGYGVSSRLGVNFIFYKKFFLQVNLKGGFINMPSVVTRSTSVADRASQHFFFLQENVMLGVSFPLIKKN